MSGYEWAIHRPLGDLALAVEVSDRLSLRDSFKVVALAQSLISDPIAGVTESVPTHRTLGVVFDPLVISFSQLSAALREREPDAARLMSLPSRVMEIPIWYDDPWSQECAAASGVENNLAYIARINDISVADVIAWHTEREHWLSAVGFQASTYQTIPLGPPSTLSAPKYERPRRTSPARTVCMAGQITSFYPFESPGGYQLLGRTPLELFDPAQRLPVFADGPVLPKVGDRHRYVAISGDEYHELRRQVHDGTVEYRIEEGVLTL